MRVRVRFFAGTRDAVGSPWLEVEAAEGASLAQLLDALERAHPKLAPYRAHALLALDGQLVPPTTRVRAGAEVAIMPPVSGGSIDDRSRRDDVSRGRVGIQRDPLSQEAILAELPKEGAGAVVVFYGHVRDDRTQRLRFEAYEEMASRELDRVRDEATAKFGLVGCVVRHRVGELGVGEAIVAVGVAAKHRREAFEAAAWAMDEIKTRVPIWKQEIAPDGSRRWVNDPTQG